MKSFRSTFRVSPLQQGGCINKGAVEKLVLKGGWEQRKWNRRYLEIDKTDIKYGWYEGSEHIEKISATSITHITAVFQDGRISAPRELKEVSDNNRHNNLILKSIWPVLTELSSECAEELRNAFYVRICTTDQAGREYIFRTSNQQEMLSWVQSIMDMIAEAAPQPKTLPAKIRKAVRVAFDSTPFRVATTLLIALNFSSSVYQTQVPLRFTPQPCPRLPKSPRKTADLESGDPTIRFSTSSQPDPPPHPHPTTPTTTPSQILPTPSSSSIQPPWRSRRRGGCGGRRTRRRAATRNRPSV
jgi:hypothetical protein